MGPPSRLDRSARPLRVRNPPLGDAPLDQLLFRVIKSAPGTDPGESHFSESRSSFPDQKCVSVAVAAGLAHSVLAVMFGTAGLVNLWLDDPAPNLDRASPIGECGDRGNRPIGKFSRFRC
jgi:hypothetical protein